MARLLLITNVDRGQANAFLAVARELLLASTVELHFATFTGLESDVYTLWKDAIRTVPTARPITYHRINGPSMEDGLRALMSTRKQNGYLPESYLTPLSLSTTMSAIRDTMALAVPYTGEDLAAVYSSIVGIITAVSPDLVVLDGLMTAGVTACRSLGVKMVFLSPNSIKDVAGPSQPPATSLCKFPALFSGFRFPVPWHLVPLNIFLVLYTLHALRTDARIKAASAYFLKETGTHVTTTFHLLRDRPPTLKILVGTLPQLDFPCIVPEWVLPCGPIVKAAEPVAQVDVSLGGWLSEGATIYVNLGSICRLSEQRAMELARSLAQAVRNVPKDAQAKPLQVLWKLKKHGEYTESAIYEILEQELERDRARICAWIEPEPISVLLSGSVVCSVHHGGANSFYEAITQVVLPQWTDCYDYAQRVEMLGIGRVGNRTSKPLWTCEELSREIVRVVDGSYESLVMREKAASLAEVCQQSGNGAQKAAEALLREVE